MPRLPARLHLLGLICAALFPVWLFAAFLLIQYALNERSRFEREAMQVARQVSLVVEAELNTMLTVIEGLSKSAALAQGDLAALHAEAAQLLQETDRVIVLRDMERRQLLNTQVAIGAELPPAVSIAAPDREKFAAGMPVVSQVYASPLSGEYRVAIAMAVRGPANARWVLAITEPTSHVRNVMLPAVPSEWIVGVGDRNGSYVARSRQHEQMTGKPGLPEYLEKIVGRSGTFTSRNFTGTTLLAGYFRSDFSGWFYTANVPLSQVEAPLWRSLAAIGAAGLIAMLVSVALAFMMGNRFARAAGDLAARAADLGRRHPVTPVDTSVAEFAVIGEALMSAERALVEREHELEAVLETVPAAVWFTYDPHARQVIRNRFAAELMGLPTQTRQSFGTPDLVIDTVALKDGRTVSRDERPLSRAMRGEQTDNEEFSYILLNGAERTLLSSARPLRDNSGNIVGAVQISLDITDRKRGEEQRKLLVNELNHRVKNTLAVVQSIASQTLRSAATLPEAGRALSSRLVSLAKAHDILTHENWSGADLRELIAGSLAPHGELDRFHLSGAAVWLPPRFALSLALGIHELATNAIKYGALSASTGTVAIMWTVTTADDAGQHLRMVWRESGGPPVSPVDHKGFGTRMLERMFDGESSGSVALSFEPSGLVCTFEVDLGADMQGEATGDYSV